MTPKRHCPDPLIAFFIVPIIIPPKEPHLIRFIRGLDEATESLIEAGCQPVFLARVKPNCLDLVEETKSPLSRISVHAYDKRLDFSLWSLLRSGLDNGPDLVGMIRPIHIDTDTAESRFPTFRHWFDDLIGPMLDDRGRRIDFVSRRGHGTIALGETEFTTWISDLGNDPFAVLMRQEAFIFRSGLLGKILPTG